MRCSWSVRALVTGTSAFYFGSGGQCSKLSKRPALSGATTQCQSRHRKMTLPVGFVILSGLPALMTPGQTAT